LCIAVISYRQR